MKLWNKILRKLNHYNAIMKDVKAVDNLAHGNTKSAIRRVNNKVKGKIARKVFNSLKF